jgi:hypothetical protein
MKVIHSVFKPGEPDHHMIFKEHMVLMNESEIVLSRSDRDRTRVEGE